MTNWELPQIDLPVAESTHLDVQDLTGRLVRALRGAGAPSEVHRVLVGPSTVKFELVPQDGVRMKDYSRLGAPADIRFALGVEVFEIEAPIPGEQLVGLEVSSPVRRSVSLSEVVPYVHAPLRAALGVEPSGDVCTLDFATLPHCFVAGASGSGKSSLVHATLSGLLMKSSPDDLGLILVDTKRVEMSRYSGLPHLIGEPVYEARAAVDALEWLCGEVDARFSLLAKHKAETLDEYNLTAPEGHVPRILCVVDEVGDLMLRSKERVESVVVRLGQLGRACGIHLLLATQSPHATIVSGIIKANMTGRIALRTTSAVASRVAIDQGGAQELLGNGDALLQDGRSTGLVRFQSAFCERATTDEITQAWRDQMPVAEGIAA